jgi:hypothetical protein
MTPACCGRSCSSICPRLRPGSALQALALRQCEWFATPLVEPAHKITPRDLLLIISGRVAIEM